MSWCSQDYTLLWNQVILPKYMSIDITFLLKSISTAFSRMPKDGAQVLSRAILCLCLKPTLHILIALDAPALLKYLWFLHRFLLLARVHGQIELLPLFPLVKSCSDPPTSGMTTQPLYNDSVLGDTLTTLRSHTYTFSPNALQWSGLLVFFLMSLWVP